MNQPNTPQHPADLQIRFEISTALREAENAVDKLHELLIRSRMEYAVLKKKLEEAEAKFAAANPPAAAPPLPPKAGKAK